LIGQSTAVLVLRRQVEPVMVDRQRGDAEREAGRELHEHVHGEEDVQPNAAGP
jgi:hypothetical protein